MRQGWRAFAKRNAGADGKVLAGDKGAAAPNALPTDTANVGIVLDTYAIMCIMDNGLDDLLLDIGDVVKSVVCARVSPFQKGEIVSLCRNNRVVKTLAIGDGANDVPMIQKAHVGVGIYGKEGLQAVNNSDFAVGQFRFLQLLMLVHGRWCYRRVSMMIYYMFYKNIACLMPQWFHGMSMHFSGQRMYYEWIHQGFNIFNTGLPIVFGAALDQDVDKEVCAEQSKALRGRSPGRIFHGQGVLVAHPRGCRPRSHRLRHGHPHARVLWERRARHGWCYRHGCNGNHGAWQRRGR